MVVLFTSLFSSLHLKPWTAQCLLFGVLGHSRSRAGCDEESVEVMCMAFWCWDVCQHLEQTRLVWRKSFAKSLFKVFSFTKPLAHTAFLRNCYITDTKLFHFATLQTTWHSTINLLLQQLMVKPFTEFGVQNLGMATRSKSILALHDRLRCWDFVLSSTEIFHWKPCFRWVSGILTNKHNVAGWVCFNCWWVLRYFQLLSFA